MIWETNKTIKMMMIEMNSLSIKVLMLILPFLDFQTNVMCNELILRKLISRIAFGVKIRSKMH